MKLHSPRFEKALRQGVKRAVRSSPELKREFRRTRRTRRNIPLIWTLLLWLSVPLGFVVVMATATTGHVATGLAVINLGMLGSLSWLSLGIWARLHAALDNQMLAFLPIAREKLFRWQLQIFFRQSLLTLLALLVCFGALAYYAGFPPWKWAAAFLIAMVCWATLLALAAFCVVRLPRAPLEIISASLILLCFVVFGSHHAIQPLALKALDQAAPELNLILPTGWPVSLFQTLTAEKPAWFLLPLLPVSVILWSARDSLKRLFEGFQYREHILGEPADDQPSPAQPLSLGPTAIAEIIQSRLFLIRPRWSQSGWLEHRLWRWFGPREKVLSDFVFPNGYAITAPWFGIFKCLGMATAITVAGGMISPALKNWALGIGLFGTIGLTLGQIINSGRAFLPIRFSGMNIPLYAGYGIGFGELSRLLFKCSIIQIPLLLAFALAAGGITAWLADFPIYLGVIFGFKAACLLFASRFIFVTLSFSAGTNGTSRFRFRSLLLISVILVFGGLFVALGGTGLFLPHQRTAWLLCLGAALDAYAFFLIYQWFYNSGRLDLMSQPNR